MADPGKQDSSFQLPVLENPSTCSTKPSLFSAEELEILAELRLIKMEAREIKLRLAENPERPDGGLAQRLDDLRARWRERSRAYEDASRRRMIALGHAKPL